MKFQHYNDLTKDQLYAILQLRSEVFVVEQDSVYQDLDGHDQASTHLLHWESDQLIAYGRICPAGTAHNVLSFGRLVTAQTHRGAGLGKQLVAEIMRYINNHYPNEPILIDAQAHLQDWYARYGFEPCGEAYDWGGIMHQPMQKSSSKG